MKKNHKKKQQKRYKHSVLKRSYMVLAVITVVLAGISGWFIYQAIAPKYTNATDSMGSFSYEYPTNWVIEPYIWEDCCEGPPKTEPDWSKETKPITLHPVKDKEVVVTFTADKYGDFWNSYKDLKAFVKEDYFAKILFDGIREDNHKALFSRVDYLGPPDAKVESFTDHRYYFDNGKYVLRVEFREKYHHDWPDDDVRPDINNTEYLSDFEHIANSILFTKNSVN